MSAYVTQTIQVSLPSDKTLDFEVPLNVDPVCELKRQLAEKVGLDPTEIRLTPLVAVDSFSLPIRLQLTKRCRNVDSTIAVHDRLYNLTEFAVARDDTILDLKFLIAQTLDIQAENVKLYLNDKQIEKPLLDSETLSSADCFSHMVYMLFEFPSHQSGHGTIHRAAPELLRFNPSIGNSVGEFVRMKMAQYPDKECMGHRTFEADGSRGEFKFVTYKVINDRISRIASGLNALGLKKGCRVCIMGENREEWTLTDWACQMRGYIVVPLYDTLGPDSTAYIVGQTEASAIVTSVSNIEKIAELRANHSHVSHLIVMDDYSSDEAFIKSHKGQGLWDLTISEVEALGAKNLVPDDFPDLDDPMTFCYSSGTTGNPKGVILTHRNFLVGSLAGDQKLPTYIIGDDDAFLSYLPLAHIFQRIIELAVIMNGHKSGYFSGNLKAVIEDISALGPAHMHGVPRIWNKIHDKVNAGVENAGMVSKFLFNSALKSGLDSLEKGEPLSWLWKKLVFSKARNAFGGKIKICLSGAAPLSPKVANFMKLFCGDHVLEGYGLTETTGGATVATIDDITFGHVGASVPCTEIKLVDIPDMNYLTTDKPYPRGEIMLRGENIFKEYYKNPEKTAEAFPFNDGWFATGDVGMWLPNGNLKIIDRKKNIFKLSQGEYIRPEHIENITVQSRYVAQAFVYGDSTKNYLVAILVPDFELLENFINSNGLGNVEPAKLCSDSRLIKLIKDDIEFMAVEEGLHRFERIRKFVLWQEEFTPESGILTPSMKLKRHQAKIFFQNQINRMYADSKL